MHEQQIEGANPRRPAGDTKIIQRANCKHDVDPFRMIQLLPSLYDERTLKVIQLRLILVAI